jgi:hypothetical protein
MKTYRFLFVATLYLMAVSAFVVFLSSVVPWFQFRFFSSPATLFLVRESVVEGPRSELKAAAEERTKGTPVRLELDKGGPIISRAHLTGEKFSGAASSRGLHVLYRRDGPDKVRVVTGLQELGSPWLWLILSVLFSAVAPYASKLYTRENS